MGTFDVRKEILPAAPHSELIVPEHKETANYKYDPLSQAFVVYTLSRAEGDLSPVLRGASSN